MKRSLLGGAIALLALAASLASPPISGADPGALLSVAPSGVVVASDLVVVAEDLILVADGAVSGYSALFLRIADPSLHTAADRIAARAEARATAAEETAQSVDMLMAAYKAAQPLPAMQRAAARRRAYAAHVNRLDELQKRLHARLVEIGPEPGATMPKAGDAGVNFIRQRPPARYSPSALLRAA